ncbi:MAG: hypothetical protein K6B28_07665, partial [Lachnospiraceae bacterium]|nr:hypothetical protein [Lachnospiraceae bacterium]
MASVYDKNMESMKKRYPYYANKIQDRYTKEYKVESGVEHIEDRTVLYTLYNDKQYQLDSLYESEALIDLWYRDYKNDDLYNVYAVFGLGNGMFIR